MSTYLPTYLATKPDLRNCERIFRAIDVEQTHRLDQMQLKNAFEKLEMAITDEQIKQITEIVDSDGDGLVTLQEFIHFVYIWQNLNDPNDVKNLLFLAADADCSGTINRQELGVILKKLGADVSPKLLQELSNAIADNKDGTISQPMFIAFIEVIMD